MNAPYPTSALRIKQIVSNTPGTLGYCATTLDGESLFALNEDETFPQASAIKIPILMEVIAQCQAGKITGSQQHRISLEDQVDGTGILSEFLAGDSLISTSDLCTLMIVLSDNTSTNMLIRLVGMERVNQLLDRLGCPQTRLQRLMRDQEAIGRGIENVSTPGEAARIMRSLACGEFVDPATSDAVLTILRKQKSSAIRKAIPNEITIASKPGAISGVATEWAIVEVPNRPFILVLMGKNGEDAGFQQAFTEIAQCIYQTVTAQK